ncbi:unnamed protein product [Closterium sp. NIES-64]|nr:unnamed protein product [Closterium sp. NIES-64]
MSLGRPQAHCPQEELPPWVVAAEEERPRWALAHPHLPPLHQAPGEGGAAPAATPLGGAEGEEAAWRNPGQVGDRRGEGRQEWGSVEGEGSLPLVLRLEGEGADILPLVLRRGGEGGDIPFLVLPHGGAGDHSPPLVPRHGEEGACEAGEHSAVEGAGAGSAANAVGEEVASGGGDTVEMEVEGASGEGGSKGEQGTRPHRHRMGEEGGGKGKVQAGAQGEQERCKGEEGEGRQQGGWKVEVGERGGGGGGAEGGAAANMVWGRWRVVDGLLAASSRSEEGREGGDKGSRRRRIRKKVKRKAYDTEMARLHRYCPFIACTHGSNRGKPNLGLIHSYHPRF